MGEPVVSVQPTRYTVSLLPEDHEAHSLYAITVEYRGGGLWAISRHGRYLGLDGQWDWGASAEDWSGWVASHWFDLDTALRLAREAAPVVRTNGHTAAEVWAATTGKDGSK